ncbi:MAG: caspase family protein, partial [Vicinamibacteria bacterium]|nr:caspase family protein [Vicinamibacteria bacterium]
MNRKIALGITLACILGTMTAASAESVRRFALVAGANRGAADRLPLRFAVSDAERFAQVIMQLGGVSPIDCVVLREPSRAAFFAALEALRTRAQQARREAARAEVLIYFSGHADEQGLMFGRELIPYRDLRAALNALNVEVGIAVLDACASGAITRLKGGQTLPAFLTDDAMRVSGYAFLTSSSENEAAQESERLQGSYFTHALLSGLRGAADTTNDGRVTLGEAYQFAFNETLAQTTHTQAGAQHPTYDIKMAGTGDVVLTDVRQTTSSLVLGAEFDGRFFVYNTRRQLVAELHKPQGRTVELGLEPGEYEVRYEQEPVLLRSRLSLESGNRLELKRDGFKQMRRIPTRRRGGRGGDRPVDRFALDQRWRIESKIGIGSTSVSTDAFTDDVSIQDADFAMAYVRWWREDWAVDVAMVALDTSVDVTARPLQDDVRVKGVVGILCGARYYPRIQGALRPYVALRTGPVSEYREETTAVSRTSVTTDTQLALQPGVGVDFLLSRMFSVGLNGMLLYRQGHAPSRSFGFTMGFAFGRGR